MIFWKLFFTFLRIGIFSFGGGLAMTALIQHEVVEEHGWLTTQEFTDVVATSQITPGPVGINIATYTGYVAVVKAGYPVWLGIAGAFLASFSVVLLPVLLMFVVYRFLMQHKDNPTVATVLKTLRITVVGLVTAAALLLMTPETFGTLQDSPRQFLCSAAIFATVCFASVRFKTSPILLILLSGVAGFILYGL